MKSPSPYNPTCSPPSPRNSKKFGATRIKWTRNLITMSIIVLSSLASTICCMPALLVLLFGFNISLRFLDFLSPYRVPLTVLSLIFLLFFLASNLSMQKNCRSCNPSPRFKYSHISFTFMVLILLFYPEILVWFF